MCSPSPAALSVIGTSLCARSPGAVPVVRTPCIFKIPSCCINDHHSYVIIVPSCCISDQHVHVFPVPSWCISSPRPICSVVSGCIRTPMVQTLATVSVISNPMYLDSGWCISGPRLYVRSPELLYRSARQCVHSTSYKEWTLWTIHRRTRGPAFPFNKWTQPLLRSAPNAFDFLRFSFQTCYRSSDMNKLSSLHPT